MEKPFTLKIMETEQNIVNVINNSELPAFCIKTILQSIMQEIQKIDEQELNKYKQKEEKEKNKKEEK